MNKLLTLFIRYLSKIDSCACVKNLIHLQNGGDRLSRKIASAIVAARQKTPIQSTAELAAIIQKACPQPRWQRGDDDMVRNSAARTFQAIRIYVNDEVHRKIHEND